MGKIHFTVDDLARTHLVPTYGPYAETLFGLPLLRKRHRTRGWSPPVSITTNGPAGMVDQLVGHAPAIDLFTVIGSVDSIDESTEALLSADRAHLQAEVEGAASWLTSVTSNSAARLPAWIARLPDDREVRATFAAGMRQCCQTIVEPYWPQLRAKLETEARTRAHTLAHHGIAQLFNNLHPDLRWQDGALHVVDAANRPPHAYLTGSGLAVVPSVFCRRVTLYTSSIGSGPSVLFYPVVRDAAEALQLCQLWTTVGPDSAHTALSALLGSTRAAALELLVQGYTTTELAHRLGVSLPTASHHTAALRGAGLIETNRRGNAVFHTVTPLGLALLNGATDCPTP